MKPLPELQIGRQCTRADVVEALNEAYEISVEREGVTSLPDLRTVFDHIIEHGLSPKVEPVCKNCRRWMKEVKGCDSYFADCWRLTDTERNAGAKDRPMPNDGCRVGAIQSYTPYFFTGPAFGCGHFQAKEAK